MFPNAAVIAARKKACHKEVSPYHLSHQAGERFSSFASRQMNEIQAVRSKSESLSQPGWVKCDLIGKNVNLGIWQARMSERFTLTGVRILLKNLQLLLMALLFRVW